MRHPHRMTAWLLASILAGTPTADWRDTVATLAERGEHRAVVELAESARTAWLAPHVAAHLEPPSRYIGWIATADWAVAYRLSPQAQTRLIQPVPETEAALLAAVSDWLDEGVWTVALDGPLEELVITRIPVIHATSARTAALSRLRVAQARLRAPSLLAYARDSLPASRAEIRLAADALAGPATLLAGPEALERLRAAAYDGTLSNARYVLIAAHAAPDPARPGVMVLELDDGGTARFAPEDTVHLRFSAELVVLSACETARHGVSDSRAAAGFAQAGLLAGVGMTLLTRWRVDDGASAQFVAALFAELADGYEAAEAVARAQAAFRDGHHGERYQDPWYWAAWQLWGG